MRRSIDRASDLSSRLRACFVLAAFAAAAACTSEVAGPKIQPGLRSSSGEPGDPDPSTPAGGSDAGVPPRDGAAPPPGEPGTLVPGKSTRSLTIAGRARSAIVVVPPQATSGKVPLVVALHGNGDTMGSFVVTSGLEQLAGQLGFVLVAPQGLDQTITIASQTINVDWDAYRTPAQGNIDLPLLDDLVDDLVASASIDERRIVSFGYSQGGYLSFRYGVERAGTLACAAVLAAANPLGPTLTNQAARKIPFSIQIGTNDFGIGQARATRTDLQQKGFPVDYREIQGAGHVPIPGGARTPLEDCLAERRP